MQSLGGSSSARSHSERLGWSRIFLLAAFACLIFLPGFFELPPIDRDEPRFAQATRQMLETGDFIDIRFQDNTRYKKPIGIYWLQAASVRIWQLTTSATKINVIWPYRVPSLLAAIASVLLVSSIGARLFDAWTGFTAGILLSLSLVLNFEARIATTDAALLACVLAVQLALARAYCRAREGTGEPDHAGAVLGWCALGLGILIKGPIIILVVAGTILGMAIARLNLSWLRDLRPVRGVLICLAMVLPWLVLIVQKSRGAFLHDSVGHDLLGKLFEAETAVRMPPGFHAVMFWIGFWPGSLIVLLALPWIWTNRREPSVQFCLAWAVPTWIAFELPVTKLFHYVLPAYPALALLGAAWLTRGAPPAWPRPMRILIISIWSTLTVVLCAAVAWAPAHLGGTPVLGVMALAAVACCAILAVHFLHRAKPEAALAVLAVSAVALWGAFSFGLPSFERALISRQILAAIEVPKGCNQVTLISSGYEEPSLVFLSSIDVRFMTGPAAAQALAASPCMIAVVDRREQKWFLERSAELRFQPHPAGDIAGVNYANSRRVNLRLYLRSPP